jgi:predicted outer membrane repeat protein
MQLRRIPLLMPFSSRVLACLLPVLPAAAATLRVPEEHASIQGAIDAAEDGDEVLVAPGVYEVSRPVLFRGKAIAVRSAAGPEATTVSMSRNPQSATRQSVFAFTGAEPSGAVLEGFTITGGRGTLAVVEFEAPAEPVLALAGGGIYCGPHAEPRLVRNVILRNTAEYGGGLFADVDSHPVLIESRFIENRLALGPRTRFPGGGGIACLADAELTIEGGTFARNQGVTGGAVFIAAGAAAAVRGVLFEENYAQFHGGAIFSRGHSLEVIDSTFRGNFSEGEPGGLGGSGGGIEVDAASRVRVLIARCLFLGNRAQRGGGLSVESLGSEGDSTAAVEDCRFAANEAVRAGGGVYTEHQRDTVLLSGCRFEGNSAPKGGGLYSAYGGATEARGSVFTSNYAVFGGAVSCEGSITRVLRSTIAGNAAGYSGGGIHVIGFDSRLVLEESILWSNAGGSLRGDLCGPQHPCFVSYSLIEGEAPWPGEGNLHLDPRLGAWGEKAEVWVDDARGGGGDGSAEEPFGSLEEALAGYSVELSPESPCIGAARDGGDLGAPGPRARAAGAATRLVHLGPGRYELAGLTLAAGASISGSGYEETFLRGPVAGLRSGSHLARLTAGGASERGGVLVAEGESPVLRQVRISGNAAPPGPFAPATSGGVICYASSPLFLSAVIAGNRHGGIRCLAGAAPSFVHATISGNEPAAGEPSSILASGSAPRFTSSIIWGNRGRALEADGGSRTEISFSIIDSETSWPGEGNLREDPLFVRGGEWDGRGTPSPQDDLWTEGDYRLAAGSPALDRGSPLPEVEVDIAGQPRACGGGPDLGAHESCGVEPEGVPFRRGDADGSGSTNITDAIAILGYLFLGAETPSCLKSADIDGDRAVNITDAVYLLGFLFLGGPAPPPPWPECGVDPSPAPGCESARGCE